MPRVSQETIEKLNAFIESLPTEARNKCAICNETLTHLVKTAEVETGAGTATVTRVLAEKINETAAPGDRVIGEHLRDRVRKQEPVIRENIPNNSMTELYPEKEGGTKKPKKKLETNPSIEPQGDCTEAHQFVSIAISQLTRIRKDDPARQSELDRIILWIEQNRFI